MVSSAHFDLIYRYTEPGFQNIPCNEAPSDGRLLTGIAGQQTEDLPELSSPFFSIWQTIQSGRSVVANQFIPAETKIFEGHAPFLNVIYKPFKKEVCAHCFCYDNGRKMKYTYVHENSKDPRGLAWFCSNECRIEWANKLGTVGIDAMQTILAAISRHKRAGSVYDDVHEPISPRDIESAWKKAASVPLKDVRLIEEEDDIDTLEFLLSGIIARFNSEKAWRRFLSLATSLQPYIDHSPRLASHIRIYHFLRIHLPMPIVSCCTPETFLAIVTRDHGNSFGIFEQDRRDGEMLGYGSWVEASFFNHSCKPNLRKSRKGRTMQFHTLRGVAQCEELCISYIGDAEPMSMPERRKRLRAGWDFLCQCDRCKDEEARARQG